VWQCNIQSCDDFSERDLYTYINLDATGPGADYARSMIAVWDCMLYVGVVIGCISYSAVADQ
jgi:hypothetical protein